MKTVILCTLLFLISCQQKQTPNYVYKKPESNETLIKIGDQSFTQKEILSDASAKIYEKQMEIYQIKMNKIRARMLRYFMEKDPKFKNMSKDEFVEKFIVKGKKPSDEEVIKYAQRRGISKGSLDKDSKNRVRAFLQIELKKKEIAKWLDEKLGSNDVQLFIEKPDRPKFNYVPKDGDIRWGKKNAPVTVVQFSDFQCHFCKTGAERMRQLKDEFGTKIQVIFKHFPMPFHQHAKNAALAAHCAYEQSEDKFWRYHDRLYENQSSLKKPTFISLAKELGLNMKKFTECYEAKRFAKKIDQDIEDGKDIYVQSIPAYFINGRLILGARPYEEFTEEVTRGLSR